jgi:MoaA/NifB/PqqE/SkfB family radical SAM enzyme
VDNQQTEQPERDSRTDAAPPENAAVTRPFGSSTFCILPWMHAFLDVNGDVKLCCIASSGLTAADGRRPLSFQRQPIRDIWNSPEMKSVREKMLSGRKVGACSRCYKEEAMGQVSSRHFHNQQWLGVHQDRDKWKQRVEESMAHGHEVSMLPAFYDIRPGNLCTLKCRMCHSDYSNLIEADPVHSKWAYRSPAPETTRFSDGKSWYQAEDTVIDELLENVEETRTFYLAGGEPLVNPFIRKLIDTLISRGVAGNVTLTISTNATVMPKPLVEKLCTFAGVRLSLSIDGCGPLFEYIRYPGKWETVARHLEEVSRISQFSAHVTTTVQNYNVLSLVDIFKSIEALGLPCNFNLLYGPEYLSVRVMPRSARELAAERLRTLMTYAEASPMAKVFPAIVLNIANVISELERDSDQFYRSSVRKFMTFTNDLDRSRGQRFMDVCPEL